MLDGFDSSGAGRITSGIESTLVARTLAFVRRQLAAWRDDPDRLEEEAENRLNAQLCKFMDTHARTDFPMVRFNHEEPQSGHRKVDLSATPARPMVIGAIPHTIYDPFLVLEGKRLPTPSSDRRKEYVTGLESTSGGIQRFKLGLHAVRLDVAAMLGYVQDRTLQDWHHDINEWILDLANGRPPDVCPWETAEILGTLDEDATDRTASCCSTHGRTGDVSLNAIVLHHLWVAMNPGDRT